MMGGIEAALAEHAFKHLFLECLGWDRTRTTVSLDVPEGRVEATAIAHQRGFPVFVAPTQRTMLANRRLLRNLQLRLRKAHHEHILIHYCETPRKQVWQWATATDDGRRILHREHPFFSNDPPPRLLERIHGLAISFNEEEEQTTPPDVLHRVRTALMPDGELNLFAKHPWCAAESDRLATAMKRGEPGAFGRFIELHIPLARHASKMLARWFGMDREDAEQTAMIGLMEAARRFDPDRGFQFSTYAGFWLRQSCQRYGLSWGLPIRLPTSVFWPCYRLTFTWARLVATYGERLAEPYFEHELAAVGVTHEQWATFCAARAVDSLSKLPPREQALLKVTDRAGIITQASSDELHDEIHQSLKHIPPREARVLCLRYGIGERQHTLQEVADQFGITRERVRQIQDRAEARLHRLFNGRTFFDPEINHEEAPVDEPTSEMAS